MEKKKLRSVIPVYAAAAAWLVFALRNPMFELPNILMSLGLSAGVYGVARLIFRPKLLELEAPAETPQLPPEQPEGSGNPELDAFLLEGERGVAEMNRLNDNIPDERLSERIFKLTELTGKICAQVQANPQKLPRAKRFVNYYLPTTIKMLNTYDRMGQQGVDGDNISSSMRKIEDILDSIVAAYEKMLDSMFTEEAMDVSADISVMETMLEREGFSEDPAGFDQIQE